MSDGIKLCLERKLESFKIIVRMHAEDLNSAIGVNAVRTCYYVCVAAYIEVVVKCVGISGLVPFIIVMCINSAYIKEKVYNIYCKEK